MQPPPLTWLDLKDHLLASFVRLVDWQKAARLTDSRLLHMELRLVVERLVDEANALLNLMERERLIDEVLDDAIGFGPGSNQAAGRTEK